MKIPVNDRYCFSLSLPRHIAISCCVFLGTTLWTFRWLPRSLWFDFVVSGFCRLWQRDLIRHVTFLCIFLSYSMTLSHLGQCSIISKSRSRFVSFILSPFLACHSLKQYFNSCDMIGRHILSETSSWVFATLPSPILQNVSLLTIIHASVRSRLSLLPLLNLVLTFQKDSDRLLQPPRAMLSIFSHWTASWGLQ